MKPRYCEDHQDYKYINFCPFCKVIADRDRLADENKRLRELISNFKVPLLKADFTPEVRRIWMDRIDEALGRQS